MRTELCINQSVQLQLIPGQYSYFIPPENTRKPLAFCCSQGYKIGLLA